MKYSIFILPEDQNKPQDSNEIVVYVRDIDKNAYYPVFLFSFYIMNYYCNNMRSKGTNKDNAGRANCLHFTNPLLIPDYNVENIVDCIKTGIKSYNMLHDMITTDHLTNDILSAYVCIDIEI
jgi:hypothetical protein